jgi:hypothetical protein
MRRRRPTFTRVEGTAERSKDEEETTDIHSSGGHTPSNREEQR